MNRLAATITCDLRLQFRNGFYYAALVVTALAALLLLRLPGEVLAQWLHRLLPALIVNNLLINTFYFVGGLVLLEQGEGTLRAQAVTPLRAGEYLASKVGTLLLLSLLENLILVWLVARGAFSPGWLLAAITLAAAFYTLSGFAVVVRYDGMNEYLLPSFLIVTALALPLLPYFGIGDTPWIHALSYLHPLQPVMLLLQGTFRPLPLWQSGYALVAGSLWACVAALAARRAYRRIALQGV